MQNYSELVKIFRVICSFESEHRVVTPCFDCLVKTSPVVKVSSKTIENWSRYLGLCVIMVKTYIHGGVPRNHKSSNN